MEREVESGISTWQAFRSAYAKVNRGRSAQEAGAAWKEYVSEGRNGEKKSSPKKSGKKSGGKKARKKSSPKKAGKKEEKHAHRFGMGSVNGENGTITTSIVLSGFSSLTEALQHFFDSKTGREAISKFIDVTKDQGKIYPTPNIFVGKKARTEEEYYDELFAHYRKHPGAFATDLRNHISLNDGEHVYVLYDMDDMLYSALHHITTSDGLSGGDPVVITPKSK